MHTHYRLNIYRIIYLIFLVSVHMYIYMNEQYNLYNSCSPKNPHGHPLHLVGCSRSVRFPRIRCISEHENIAPNRSDEV